MSSDERYFSQMIMPGIGQAGQEKIGRARVLVVGAGGLGCPVLLYLAAMGVGRIGIIDGDCVELSNLHRQVLYDEQDIGQLKAETAKEKLQKKNSGCTYITYPFALDNDNAAGIFSEYDIIVDCCDNMPTRYLIDRYCGQSGKPFIYGAIGRNEGQVSVFRYRNGPAFTDLFPEDNFSNAVLNCADAGIVGYAAGFIACLQVNEVLKIILQDDTVLSGYVVSADLQTLILRKLRINTPH